MKVLSLSGCCRVCDGRPAVGQGCLPHARSEKPFVEYRSISIMLWCGGNVVVACQIYRTGRFGRQETGKHPKRPCMKKENCLDIVTQLNCCISLCIHSSCAFQHMHICSHLRGLCLKQQTQYQSRNFILRLFSMPRTLTCW